MSTATEPVTFIGDTLASVNHLLGYEPAHSLIALGVTAHGERSAVRVALHDEPVSLDQLDYLSARLMARECDEITLLAYSPGPGAKTSLDRASFHCEAFGIWVLDRILVTDTAASGEAIPKAARS